MTLRLAASLLSSAFAFAAFATHADDPTDNYAPPACKKPVLITNMRKADDDSDFRDKFAVYQDCIKAYVDDQNKLANLHVTAANKAVAEANVFIKESNDKLSESH